MEFFKPYSKYFILKGMMPENEKWTSFNFTHHITPNSSSKILQGIVKDQSQFEKKKQVSEPDTHMSGNPGMMRLEI